MRLNTETSDMVREYYLNLEEVMFDYGRYTAMYMMEKNDRQVQRLAIKDKAESKLKKRLKQEKERVEQAEQEAEQAQLKAEQAQLKAEQEKEARIKAERKAIRVHKFMKKVSVKEKKMEWIYIATNKYYSRERLHKIGSTVRLSSRIGGYNTGRAKGVDDYYYVWAIKCYNARDIDNHIQKLLGDFKWNDPKKPLEQSKDNRSEMYHGIKFEDLRDIVTFIVNNYDASVDYINNFIKTRLDASMEEEDIIPPPLDYKRLTYQIGDHIETIDIEEEEHESIIEAFEDILTGIKQQNERKEEPVVVERKDLVKQLLEVTNVPKKDIWTKIKEFTGWTNSKLAIDEGSFQYKIKY
jgi:hypothetical protein